MRRFTLLINPAIIELEMLGDSMRLSHWTIAAASLLCGTASMISAQTPQAPAAVVAPPNQPCTGGYQPPVPLRMQMWTMDQYPSSAMRAEEEGDVAVAITVGTNGRAIDVEITQRAASEALNQAAIDVIMRRGRFNPALQDCVPVVGEFETVIRWRLF